MKSNVFLKAAYSLLITASILLTSCNNAKSDKPTEMPLLNNLGNYAFPITTQSKQAQQYFNQGMILGYGFNHIGALRSFKMAAKYDQNAAMAYWGQAYVLGPNLNMPMNPNNEPKAYALAKKAVELRQGVTSREKALITALAQRYSQKPLANRKALDKRWLTAIAKVHRNYPNDPDIATLYAEALMLLRPWNYWQANHKPYSETTKTINVLEATLAKHPAHIGAIHYYIHITEASSNPYRAEAAADRLNSLQIATGHLAHMPSHIFMRIGRYDDAIKANKRAIKVDEDYIAQVKPNDIYPIVYYPHNVHFIAWGYMMKGKGKQAMENANKSADITPVDAIKEKTMLNSFAVMPYFVLVRFNRWNKLLATPEPPNTQPYIKAIWLYATGVANARLGNIDQAEKSLHSLKKIANDKNSHKIILLSYNTAGPIMKIAVQALAADIAFAKKDFAKAVQHFKQGIKFEAALNYNEPPDWLVSLRQNLGDVYLAINKPAKAEKLFRQELQRHPNSGWALQGIYQSLLKQDKKQEAATVKQQLDEAWK